MVEITGKGEVEGVVDLVCDICDQSCQVETGHDNWRAVEHATLFGHWGYHSNNKDMTEHECHMCEDCYDKVKKFIEEDLKGRVRINEYLIGQSKRKLPWLL